MEDVNAAAAEIAPSKLKDLQRDSPQEADALIERVISLTEFCRDRKHAYFLVDSRNRTLDEQMRALQHLRFTHLLAQSETIPDAKSQRFNVYLLDAAQLSVQRAIQGVDFDGWKEREKRRNRKLIYSLDWTPLGKATGTLRQGSTAVATRGKTGQMPNTGEVVDGQEQLFGDK